MHSTCLNLWRPVGSFMGQRMAISFPIPVFKVLKSYGCILIKFCEQIVTILGENYISFGENPCVCAAIGMHSAELVKMSNPKVFSWFVTR